MVKWFRRKKEEPKEFKVTCPRCSSEDIGFPLIIDEAMSGSRVPKESHFGVLQCQQCGFIFRWDYFVDKVGIGNLLGG